MASLKKIKEIIRQNASAYEALMDFEETGRTIIKTRMNFTIDRAIAREFREHCRKGRINMSEAVEGCIKNLVKH